jgi:hypothetical protein
MPKDFILRNLGIKEYMGRYAQNYKKITQKIIRKLSINISTKEKHYGTTKTNKQQREKVFGNEDELAGSVQQRKRSALCDEDVS